jgi:predicted RND superfamily exporter protein
VQKIISFIIRHRIWMLVICGILALLSVWMSTQVRVNYSLADYLPESMNSKQGVDILEEEFSLNGSANLILSDMTIPEILETKAAIQDIDGVDSVIWLDDAVDIRQPLSMASSDVVEEYYKDGKALFTISFTEDDHSPLTNQALGDIRALLGEDACLTGQAVNAQNTIGGATRDIMRFTIVGVVIIIILLILTTSSFIEPLLFLITLGVAVAINMGTNLFFGSISFITNMAANILQMAMAMDYSIMLLHRFTEERHAGRDVTEAMAQSIRKTFSSISASAFTTIAGFATLVLMRYQIGADMGFVLAKGILISLLTVVLVLPALVILFSKAIERTHHRPFLPFFGGMAKGLIRVRFVGLALAVLLFIPSFLATDHIDFVYGDTAKPDPGNPSYVYQQKTEEIFGKQNTAILMVPRGDRPAEAQMAADLHDSPYVNSVRGLATLVHASYPDDMLPRAVQDQFLSAHYSRYILKLNTEGESEAAFAAVDAVRVIAQSYYDTYYLTGTTPSTSDIRDVAKTDFSRVSLICVLVIGVILLLTFRSLSLPFLILAAIESSIWINMGIPYFIGTQLSFLGYMIVSNLQLGATVDYAILYTNRYRENLHTLDHRAAAVQAIADSAPSIITSAAILSGVTISMGYLTSVQAVSEMAILIGRGALLSMGMVFILLPALLMLFDPVIRYTTLKWPARLKPKRKEMIS